MGLIMILIDEKVYLLVNDLLISSTI